MGGLRIFVFYGKLQNLKILNGFILQGVNQLLPLGAFIIQQQHLLHGYNIHLLLQINPPVQPGLVHPFLTVHHSRHIDNRLQVFPGEAGHRQEEEPGSRQKQHP
ncbi:hypothetical protein D3C76_1476290 [compost metagenome]